MATRVYLYLLLALHAAALIILLPAGGVLAVAPKIWLTGESFSVSATLDISSQQTDDRPPRPAATTRRYYLEELHSAWQLRSKVRYKIVRQSPGPDDELIMDLPAQVREVGTFFADHEQLLVMNEAGRFCEALAGGRELIDQLLTDDLLNGFAHERHLIGAGRLFYFVDENRDKFERVQTSGDNVATQTEYTATLRVAQTGAKFEVTLLYSGQVDGTGSSHPQSITIRRQEPEGHTGRVLRFTFQRVLKLEPGALLYGPLADLTAGASRAHWESPIGGGDRDQRGHALAFDLFALERAIGCSNVMIKPKLAPMDMARPDPRGFTLTARVDLQLVREPLQVTVGYDPALYSLKVSKVGETRTTDMLTNFRQDRSYYSTRRRTGATGSDLILDSILQVGGGDSSPQLESTCVVVRASLPPDKTEVGWSALGRHNHVSPHTQGQLLLGSHSLVYMGMARVRGIDANVYESYDSQLPVWLQAPAVYKDLASGGGGDHWRVNSPEGVQAPTLLTSVFYFSRHGRSSDNLLLVEIFKSPRPGLGAASAAIRKDMISIPVHEFAWRESGAGQARAPNGARLENFYSLGSDQCLARASRAQNQYARLDLMLESLVSANDSERDSTRALTDWMHEPSKRNLALMRALQEQFGVPSQSVYDLNSRYHDEPTTNAFAITLRLAQRQETRSELQLLGRGQFRPEIRQRFRVFLAYSFQACHMIAAQKESDLTLFLFDPIRSLCYLYKGDIEQLPEDEAKLLEFLVANPAKQQVSPTDFRLLEAYKVVHESDTIAPGQGASGTIEQLRERLTVKSDLYLTDPSLEPPPVSFDEQWAPAKSHFKIAKFDLNPVNPKSVAQLTDQETGTQVESDSNKFPGFGLAAMPGSDDLIHPVYAKWVSGPTGDRPGLMTYEQCQTACLASAECRSYSTCILDGQMHCLVSSVSFRSADLVSQLLLLARKPAKPGAIFALNLNNTGILDEEEAHAHLIHVMRHPSCELHNKSYRKLFKEPSRRVTASLANRTLRPVSSSEQCARMCFTSTWEFMREQGANDEPTGESSKMGAHIQRRLTHEVMADISKWAREYRESICDSFLYLDLDEVKRLDGGRGGPSALVSLKAKIQGLNHEGPTRGYCVIDKSELEINPTTGGDTKQNFEPEVSLTIEAEQFEFNFLVLYEATPGLSLVESPKSDLEKAAYHSVSYGRAIAPDELRALKLFLDRGDNSGQARPADSAGQCARECFQQLTGPSPWPACRSFSYMEVWHAERGKRYSFCLFNSITLRQAHAQERSDLVRQEPQKQNRICVLASEQVQIWHYDPKLGLVANSLDQVYHQVGLGQMDAAQKLANSNGDVHLGASGLLLSMTLILVLGVTLGIWLGKVHYLKRVNGGQPSDVDQLVAEGATRRSRPTRVVFENAHHRPAY